MRVQDEGRGKKEKPVKRSRCAVSQEKWPDTIEQTKKKVKKQVATKKGGVKKLSPKMVIEKGEEKGWPESNQTNTWLGDWAMQLYQSSVTRNNHHLEDYYLKHQHLEHQHLEDNYLKHLE